MSRRKEIIKPTEINKIELEKKIQMVNEAKKWFFEKINKIDKTFSQIHQEKKKTQNP